MDKKGTDFLSADVGSGMDRSRTTLRSHVAEISISAEPTAATVRACAEMSVAMKVAVAIWHTYALRRPRKLHTDFHAKSCCQEHPRAQTLAKARAVRVAGEGAQWGEIQVLAWHGQTCRVVPSVVSSCPSASYGIITSVWPIECRTT